MNAFHFSPTATLVLTFLSLSLLPHCSWGFDLDACHACFGGDKQNGCTYCVKDIVFGANKARVEMCDCDEDAVRLYGDCTVFESSYKVETNIDSGCEILANPKKFATRVLLIGLAVLFVLIMACVGCCLACSLACCCKNKDGEHQTNQQHELVDVSGDCTMTTGIEKPKETI